MSSRKSLQKKLSPRIPPAPPSITKGSTLKILLDVEAVRALSLNLKNAYPTFQKSTFQRAALKGISQLELMDRGRFLGRLLHEYLPPPYEQALSIILETLTPPLEKTEKNGLGVFFYLPHTNFVAEFGRDPKWNNGKDPFPASMHALSELTRRFTSEFAIRPFLISHEKRVLPTLMKWTKNECPHIRRLCSEGTRSRLPWGMRLPSFIRDPSPVLPILEALKDDSVLYVRRSVANHVGDIAKDHPELAISICKRWLKDASPNRKWVIRHALRYLAKRENRKALALRNTAS